MKLYNEKTTKQLNATDIKPSTEIHQVYRLHKAKPQVINST